MDAAAQQLAVYLLAGVGLVFAGIFVYGVIELCRK